MTERNQNDRPDPDALLKALTREGKKRRGGKLYIFLGMAPGVGKTFAMLLAAHEALKDGTDIVAGVVETHGRKETEELLKGIEVIPKKTIEYRGVQLKEMDLDAVLERKPKLVLVDELAHTNIPGSRHAKRWQDVYEILDAGIDVFSTLNVQHLESRKEAVGQIAQITVHESVPDSVLDRAFQIRLIDLSPADLLKRLKEGKVYLGEKAELAASNFFKEENLTALREIALRMAAERVDADLQSLAATREVSTPWAVVERLLVLVDEGPGSEELIRATRRLAYNLEAPWIALHIDAGAGFSNLETTAIAKHLELARNLGAEVVSVTSPNTVGALVRVARQKNVTQIVVGRPHRKTLRDWLEGGSFLERLMREAVDLSVHVVNAETLPPKRWFKLSKYFEFYAPFGSYLKGFWLTLVSALAGSLLSSLIGYQAIGFLFLLMVLVFGLIESIGPVLFVAILSAMIWNYFFIPPTGGFHIGQTHDVLMVLSFLLAAVVVGVLTHRIKRQQNILLRREERSRLLHEIVWDLATATNKKEMLEAVCKRSGKFLNGVCDVAIRRAEGGLKPFNAEKMRFSKPEYEMGVAKWTFDNNKQAGWSTETLSSSEALYVPMNGSTGTIGVFAFKPNQKTTLSPDDIDLLFMVTRQIALAVEKEFLRDQGRETERLKDVEKLQRTILEFISNELRKPLSMIAQTVSMLVNQGETLQDSRRHQLHEHLLDATEKLNVVIDNLVTMSRLKTGIFPLDLESYDPKQLVAAAFDRVERGLVHHPVVVRAPDLLPPVKADLPLIRQALANVLLNAAIYGAEKDKIEVEIETAKNGVEIRILNQGPGIPDEFIGHVFDKFYRVPGSKGEGAGLGLAVARGVIKAHGGKISAANRPTGGVAFTIVLPSQA